MMTLILYNNQLRLHQYCYLQFPKLNDEVLFRLLNQYTSQVSFERLRALLILEFDRHHIIAPENRYALLPYQSPTLSFDFHEIHTIIVFFLRNSLFISYLALPAKIPLSDLS